MYRLFIRNWWKREKGKLVPNPTARKQYIGVVFSNSEQAREYCLQYNRENPSGVLARKCEFEAF